MRVYLRSTHYVSNIPLSRQGGCEREVLAFSFQARQLAGALRRPPALSPGEWGAGEPAPVLCAGLAPVLCAAFGVGRRPHGVCPDSLEAGKGKMATGVPSGVRGVSAILKGWPCRASWGHSSGPGRAYVPDGGDTALWPQPIVELSGSEGQRCLTLGRERSQGCWVPSLS